MWWRMRKPYVNYNITDDDESENGNKPKRIPILLTEVWHMTHFWVSYGRCTMPGSPMGRSEGLSRR